MIKLDKLVIVEGKYDKIKLEGIIDDLIITTDGFGIFSNKRKIDFIKRMAELKGIVIITDGDSAGFKIRNFIKSIVPAEQITNVYIPDVFGKEKRKRLHSKEGKLGVEGIDSDILTECIKKAGVDCKTEDEPVIHTSAYDLVEAGVSGGKNSRKKKKALTDALELPERVSTPMLLQYINTVLTKDEFENILNSLES